VIGRLEQQQYSANSLAFTGKRVAEQLREYKEVGGNSAVR